MNNLLERAADVDGIPVVWIQPDNQGGDARVALWLPWLSGTAVVRAAAARRGAVDWGQTGWGL